MLLQSGTVLGSLVLLLCLCWLTLAKPVTRPVCNDPVRKQLEEAWGQGGGGNGWHDSLYNVGDLHKHLPDLHFSNVPEEYLAVRSYNLGSTKCPYDSRDANHTDLCPSYDVINYDPNRIPDTLFEKTCSCSKCGAESFRLHRNSTHTVNTHCKEMKYPIRVLRRVNCINTTYIYRVIAEFLTVGCYCEASDNAKSPRST